jgi:hypothetical protein
MHRPFCAPLAVHGLAAIAAPALVLLMFWPGSPGQLGNKEIVLPAAWMLAGALLLRRHNGDEAGRQGYPVLGWKKARPQND